MTAIDSRWSAGPARRFRDDRAKRDIVKDEGLVPMSAVTQDRVMAALRQVIDPDRDQDIVSLGMISGVQVREGHVGFAIEVDPQRGPKLERHDLHGIEIVMPSRKRMHRFSERRRHVHVPILAGIRRVTRREPTVAREEDIGGELAFLFAERLFLKFEKGGDGEIDFVNMSGRRG